LPEHLLLRLAGLAELFTRPTWWNALLLMAGAIMAPGKRTVTAALRILGREQDTDFPIYHGVLNRAVWSSRAVAGWLLRLLVGTFLSADATVVIGIDDTIERRWGHKISARGIYRDPVRSSKGHFVKTSGLRWLSAQLLVHIPWAGRIMGLPFLTMLAPSKRFYAGTPRAPKTLLDWARQAALQIHRWLPGRRIVMVGDTAPRLRTRRRGDSAWPSSPRSCKTPVPFGNAIPPPSGTAAPIVSLRSPQGPPFGTTPACPRCPSDGCWRSPSRKPAPISASKPSASGPISQSFAPLQRFSVCSPSSLSGRTISQPTSSSFRQPPPGIPKHTAPSAMPSPPYAANSGIIRFVSCHRGTVTSSKFPASFGSAPQTLSPMPRNSIKSSLVAARAASMA
jgi:hypothetical protein